MENSDIVYWGDGGLKQGSNFGDGGNWEDPLCRPGGGIHGPWWPGGGSDVGDCTVHRARKGARPQGLAEGSMAWKLDLPLNSAPPPPVQLSPELWSGRISLPQQPAPTS